MCSGAPTHIHHENIARNNARNRLGNHHRSPTHILKTNIARLFCMLHTGHQKGINHVSFSPDGRLLASGSFDKSAKVWDGRTGKQKDRQCFPGGYFYPGFVRLPTRTPYGGASYVRGGNEVEVTAAHGAFFTAPVGVQAASWAPSGATSVPCTSTPLHRNIRQTPPGVVDC